MGHSLAVQIENFENVPQNARKGKIILYMADEREPIRKQNQNKHV